MRAIVKVEMFNLPNFLRLKDSAAEAGSMDVGACFPTDADARNFWLECGDAWVAHVRARREQLDKDVARSEAEARAKKQF